METLFKRAICRRSILLKFCYFLLLVVFISCKKEIADNANSSTTNSNEIQTEENESNQVILFYGDSITAGYGLDDANDAYPGVIQSKIDSLDWDYEVINSGSSGETSAGGRSRIDWVQNQKIDVFVLELGANDGLRGLPVNQTKANLQAIIDAVRAHNPTTKIVLAGMQLPPNMGQQYTTAFKSIFPELATENDIALIPFILDNVGGVPELNQNDGIHPTVKGHQIVANNVWAVLKDILDPQVDSI